MRKVSVADLVYGPIGALITAKNSTSRDVAQIGQVDLTWDISRVLQLQALYARIFAGQYIRDAGGRDFDYYRPPDHGALGTSAAAYRCRATWFKREHGGELCGIK